MHHLCPRSRRHPSLSERIHGMSSPGGILNALATALHGSIRTAPSIHRLRLGLLGYLIPFAPLAFVSQCQCRPSRVLSPLVFFPISTHFTAPPEIPSAPTVLQLGSFHRLSRVEPWDWTADLKSHLQTPYAQSFQITLACILCLTAAAGTELADAYSSDTVIASSPGKEVHDPWAFYLHAALLRQAFAHCGKFPTAASRRSLGRVSVPVWLIILSDQLLIIALLLPHQLANQTQAPPRADSSFCSSAYGPGVRSQQYSHPYPLTSIPRASYPFSFDHGGGASQNRKTHIALGLGIIRLELMTSTTSRFYRKKILFSMFYSILVGEEPDSVLLKKERKQNQVKTIRINPFFLRQRSYHFRRNWSYISFQFPFKSSYVFPRPFETSKKGQIPFLRLTSLLLSWYNPLPAEPPFLLGPQRQNVGLVPTVHHGRKDSPSRDH
ncbi:LOW QUALITY PROTEIN: hypothetical protein CKAN_02749800 [Cinnamomum micranthum f. kanehirae]|uniref:Uncharacterized protein n=2 Tax=Cinnamomum micranthum f. kanehirae TaxID=337451 RepID=A0A3S3PC43_9MAGN|nr:LOW QUALITY PROTEIN: hypothetical protein CKAN_02749800 [Cinnamomum micranthum f. kanehirae]